MTNTLRSYGVLENSVVTVADSSQFHAGRSIAQLLGDFGGDDISSSQVCAVAPGVGCGNCDMNNSPVIFRWTYAGLRRPESSRTWLRGHCPQRILKIAHETNNIMARF